MRNWGEDGRLPAQRGPALPAAQSGSNRQDREAANDCGGQAPPVRRADSYAALPSCVPGGLPLAFTPPKNRGVRPRPLLHTQLCGDAGQGSSASQHLLGCDRREQIGPGGRVWGPPHTVAWGEGACAHPAHVGEATHPAWRVCGCLSVQGRKHAPGRETGFLHRAHLHVASHTQAALLGSRTPPVGVRHSRKTPGGFSSLSSPLFPPKCHPPLQPATRENTDPPNCFPMCPSCGRSG